ncbi:LysR family transcriptional regulator, partial [Streptomyces althioticus]
MRRDLDIRPLRTLVTIVDVGGFRRASKVLSISQPAVSQHIRRLDALIGEPVFRE